MMKLHIYGSDFKIQNKLSFLPDILGLWHVKNVGKLQKNMSNCWYQFFLNKNAAVLKVQKCFTFTAIRGFWI